MMSNLPWRRRRIAGLTMALAAVALAAPAIAAAPPTSAVIADIALSKPFGARSPWRLVVAQGPQVPDPNDPGGPLAPGVVSLCLRKTTLGDCDIRLDAMRPPPPHVLDWAWAAHFLNAAKVVHPGGGRAPLLLVRTASLRSGDGDQAVFTQLFAYRRARDQFARVYSRQTGHNNDQEVRFVSSGPLQGSVIAAEPRDNAPFGFWISVSRLTADDRYKQVLRYRSATRYNDGNPLAVIDSEMPNIERRLGLWRPGAALPLPAGKCPKPRLVRMELWCS